MLNVNPDTVLFIIDKAHEFQMLSESGVVEPAEEPAPAFAELKTTIEDLEPDQQVSLVALMWIGRGDYTPDEWDQAFADAGDSWNERTAEYLIGTPLLADYLSEGLDLLGASGDDDDDRAFEDEEDLDEDDDYDDDDDDDDDDEDEDEDYDDDYGDGRGD